MEANEKIELISEELKLCMNLDAEIILDRYIFKLKLYTIAGVFIFIPDPKQTVMFNVYRFISNYGSKLHSWGLSSKIKEYKI